MTDQQLAVAPAGLWAASTVLAGQAGQPESPPGNAGSGAEMSGRAAAALHRAIDGYCAAWSGRLSLVSAALEDAGSCYAATDTASGAALAAIAPAGLR
jgi:hypothetical protein